MQDARPTLDAPDDDPYRWLEEVEGEAATRWVDAQSARTVARLCDPRYDADRDILRALLDRPENLPYPARRGGAIYNFWRDAAHPRGLWRRTTLDSFRADAPAWEVLLDLDALATEEGEDWVWQGADTLPPTHARAILRLSRGGSDAAVTREFDLERRAFVPDGFHLPETKGGTDWLDADTLLLSAALGGATEAGYPRAIRLWRRGEEPTSAPVLFEVERTHMGAWGGFDRVGGRVIYTDQIGFFHTSVSIGDRSGPQRTIDLPTDAGFRWEKRWLAVRPRTAWAVDGRTLPPDTVAVVELEAFLAGERAVTVVFEPAPRRALQGFFWSDGRLVLSVLDEMRPEFLVLSPPDWAPVRLAGFALVLAGTLLVTLPARC